MKLVPWLLLLPVLSMAASPIDVGSRRELFVDDHLIQELEGEIDLRLNHPTPREIAIVHDAPWEGTGSGYHSIFKDGDRYRMYYKAVKYESKIGRASTRT